MAVALGGRVAEELIYGPDNVTTGASGDFQQVGSLLLPAPLLLLLLLLGGHVLCAAPARALSAATGCSSC